MERRAVERPVLAPVRDRARGVPAPVGGPRLRPGRRLHLPALRAERPRRPRSGVEPGRARGGLHLSGVARGLLPAAGGGRADRDGAARGDDRLGSRRAGPGVRARAQARRRRRRRLARRRAPGERPHVRRVVDLRNGDTVVRDRGARRGRRRVAAARAPHRARRRRPGPAPGPGVPDATGGRPRRRPGPGRDRARGFGRPPRRPARRRGRRPAAGSPPGIPPAVLRPPAAQHVLREGHRRGAGGGAGPTSSISSAPSRCSPASPRSRSPRVRCAANARRTSCGWPRSPRAGWAT